MESGIVVSNLSASKAGRRVPSLENSESVLTRADAQVAVTGMGLFFRVPVLLSL